MTKKLIIGALVVLILGCAGYFLFTGNGSLSASPTAGTGPTHFQAENFLQGFFAGTSGKLKVDNTGAVTEGGNSVFDTTGVLTGVIGGSAHATLAITTSTTLTGAQLCTTDTYAVTTSTAAITLTLPTATSIATNCLVQDGTYEAEFLQLQAGNAFNVTVATSTGDILTWNGTSTAGGATLASSSGGSYFKIELFRLSSSSIVATIGNFGTAH